MGTALIRPQTQLIRHRNFAQFNQGYEYVNTMPNAPWEDGDILESLNFSVPEPAHDTVSTSVGILRSFQPEGGHPKPHVTMIGADGAGLTMNGAYEDILPAGVELVRSGNGNAGNPPSANNADTFWRNAIVVGSGIVATIVCIWGART